MHRTPTLDAVLKAVTRLASRVALASTAILLPLTSWSVIRRPTFPKLGSACARWTGLRATLIREHDLHEAANPGSLPRASTALFPGGLPDGHGHNWHSVRETPRCGRADEAMLRGAKWGAAVMAIGMAVAVVPAATASASIEKSSVCKAYKAEENKQLKASSNLSKVYESGNWSKIQYALLSTFSRGSECRKGVRRVSERRVLQGEERRAGGTQA